MTCAFLSVKVCRNAFERMWSDLWDAQLHILKAHSACCRVGIPPHPTLCSGDGTNYSGLNFFGTFWCAIKCSVLYYSGPQSALILLWNAHYYIYLLLNSSDLFCTALHWILLYAEFCSAQCISCCTAYWSARLLTTISRDSFSSHTYMQAAHIHNLQSFFHTHCRVIFCEIVFSTHIAGSFFVK